MVRVTKLAGLVSFAFVLSSCSTTETPEPVSVFNDPRFEVVTPVQQAKEEIAKMPQEFLVSSNENLYAWERAETFFKSYTKSPDKVRQGEIGNRSAITNRGVFGEQYQFAVTREEVDAGYRYKVNCFLPANIPGECSLNAKNVARFIRDGYLERSLLN